MATLDTAPERAARARRAGIASFVGTAVEWYDFYIFGTAAALVFGTVFFPSASPAAGLLASFATLWVGFVARPLGGVIFGHLGDRFGRRGTLVTTLVLMGAATTCIGLLPGYHTIGVAAPVLLVLLRFLQGVAVGGEWGGAVLMASESAEKGRGIFAGMFVQQGSPAGSILATLAFLAASQLDDAAFLSWGWRVPFLISAVLVVIGLVVRLKVEETPEFTARVEERKPERAPIMQVLTRHPVAVVFALMASVSGIGAAYFTNTFMLSYTTSELAVPRQTMLNILLVLAIVQFLWQPFAALIAERVGPARFMTVALLGNVVVALPMFLLVQTAQPGAILLGLVLSIITGSAYYAVLAGFLAAAFPPEVRYTGISVSYQLCSTLIGGTTPFIAQFIVNRTGGWGGIAVFYVIILLVTVAGVVGLAAHNRRQVRSA
ncbi:MFS transporter [Actinoplanes couchii]|uniref:MFS transporter n=1 Tax=Actinoplanes couchii TaxID=403638 RepID=A0ABQ3XGG4_9ACTN|nr:MFS transporter [Actinoplanes couchii]MDR6321063.1 MFS family permease [Actinoplanes couchii]GID57574.1 MFS transporter [Actinoplanes couchii]